jgi:hypothetical protein
VDIGGFPVRFEEGRHCITLKKINKLILGPPNLARKTLIYATNAKYIKHGEQRASGQWTALKASISVRG